MPNTAKKSFNAFLPHILSISFLLMLFAFSSLFGYSYELPKFLVFLGTTFVLAVYFIVSRSPLFFPKPHVLYLGLVSLILVAISSLLSTHGAILLSLSHLSLWVALSLILAFEAKRMNSDLFIEKFIGSFLPIVFFVILVSIFYEFLLGGGAQKPFWGNVNISADFISLGLLQILFSIKFSLFPKYKKLLTSFLIFGLVLLLVYASRAAILGLLFGTTFLYRDYLKEKFKSKNVKLGVVLVIVFFLGIFINKGFDSIKTRFSHWINTASLISESFLFGSGPSSFEVLYEKYNGSIVYSSERIEHLIVTSPHNFILESLVSLGFLGTFIFYAFLASVTLNVVRVKNKQSISRNWVLANSIVYIPSLLFAFPQKLPFTLMFSSVILAIALSLQFENKKLNKAPAFVFRFIIFLFTGLCAWTLSSKAYSEFLTMNSRGVLKHDGLRRACTMDHENWRACAGLARSAIQAEDWPLAEWAMSQLEHRYKGYHPTLILNGEYYLKKSQRDLACENFLKYQSLFLKPTSVDSIIEKNCNI